MKPSDYKGIRAALACGLVLFACATSIASPPNPLDRRAPGPPRNPLDKGGSAGGSAAAAVQPHVPGDLMRFTRLSVRDPGINNIECVSFLVPVGWKSEGGVQWFHDFSILANVLMTFTEPQTGAAIQLLPIQNFTWLTQTVMPMQPGTNYMGSIFWQPVSDIPQFIETFYAPTVLPHLRGARPASSSEMRAVAELVAKSYGGQSQVKSERIRYEFDVNGRPWEEDVYITLVFTNWQMGTMWTVNGAYSCRAPKGMLDKMTPLMTATVNSAKLSLDWYAGYRQVQQLFNNRMKQGIKDATDLSRRITQNNEEIRQMWSEAYNERQASQDRIAESVSETIRGVETFKNPYEDRPVQLPSGYNDAWVNPQGEYILSNTAGFDPNVGSTSEWRRMDHPEQRGR